MLSISHGGKPICWASESVLSIASVDSYHTAASASSVFSALTPEGHSNVRSLHGCDYYLRASYCSCHRSLMQPLHSPQARHQTKACQRQLLRSKRDNLRLDDNSLGWNLDGPFGPLLFTSPSYTSWPDQPGIGFDYRAIDATTR